MVSDTHTEFKVENLSVCIPAHNEELTIGKTLEAILGQEFDHGSKPEIEVLVCANVCTDNTVGEVRRIQQKYPNEITLIEVAEKGKSNACNVLRKRALYDIVFFIDADTELDRTALAVMSKELQSSDDLIAVGGTNAAVMSGCSFMTRLSRPYAKNGILIRQNQDFIAGRCYGIRRARFEAVMEEFGFHDIPEHLINEDRWIHRLLDVAASKHKGLSLESVIRGEGRYWTVCPDALAYFVPQDWREDSKLKARSLHGRDQMSAYFPEYDEARAGTRVPSSKTIIQKVPEKFAMLREMGGVEGFRYIVSELMKKLAVRRARRLYEWNKANSVEISAQNWIRSETSRTRDEAGIRA